ncbi:MAG: pentapeptide repeat-containing protein [Candidatus Micrarchaeaceae archaeon]
MAIVKIAVKEVDQDLSLKILTPFTILDAKSSRTFSNPNECLFIGRYIRDRIIKQKTREGQIYILYPATFNGKKSIMDNLSFYQCDIQHGVFDNACFSYSEFVSCNLSYATFNGRSTSIFKVNFESSSMKGVGLKYADAEGAEFTNLKSSEGMDFFFANIAYAKFSGTDLRKAKNLEYTRNLHLADFSGAILNSRQKAAIKMAILKNLIRQP